MTCQSYRGDIYVYDFDHCSQCLKCCNFKSRYSRVIVVFCILSRVALHLYNVSL